MSVTSAYQLCGSLHQCQRVFLTRVNSHSFPHHQSRCYPQFWCLQQRTRGTRFVRRETFSPALRKDRQQDANFKNFWGESSKVKTQQERWDYMPSKDTIQRCRDFGFTKQQMELFAQLLHNLIQQQMMQATLQNLLQNYWQDLVAGTLENLPSKLRAIWERNVQLWERVDIVGAKHNYRNVQLSEIGYHSPQDMASAIALLARDHALVALGNEEAQARQPMMGAINLFGIAASLGSVGDAKLGSLNAAVFTIKILAEGLGKKMLDANILTKSDGAEQDLLKAWVSDRPSDCPDYVVTTFMDLEFADRDLRKQPPDQLAWAVAVLQRVAQEVVVASTTQDAQPYFLRFRNPSAYVHRIADHCVRNSIVLPLTGHSTKEDLVMLRDQALRDSAAYHDPASCFVLAVRGCDFGSEEWAKLMVVPATNCDNDACWLLALHYWRKDGVLPIQSTAAPKNRSFLQSMFATESRPVDSDGFDYAKVAMYAALQQRPSFGDRIFLNRGLTIVALYTLLEDRRAGERLLEEMLEHAKNEPSVSKTVVTNLASQLRDYVTGGPESLKKSWWSDEKCEQIVKKEANHDVLTSELRARFG